MTFYFEPQHESGVETLPRARRECDFGFCALCMTLRSLSIMANEIQCWWLFHSKLLLIREGKSFSSLLFVRKVFLEDRWKANAECREIETPERKTLRVAPSQSALHFDCNETLTAWSTYSPSFTFFLITRKIPERKIAREFRFPSVSRFSSRKIPVQLLIVDFLRENLLKIEISFKNNCKTFRQLIFPPQRPFPSTATRENAGRATLRFIFSSELASLGLSVRFSPSLDGKLSCDKGRSFRGGCEYLNENWFFWGNCGKLWLIISLVDFSDSLWHESIEVRVRKASESVRKASEKSHFP